MAGSGESMENAERSPRAEPGLVDSWGTWGGIQEKEVSETQRKTSVFGKEAEFCPTLR